MSRLLILGNTNKFTFCNAIVAAQYKSKKYLNEQISDIYVIHSKESFHKLFIEEEDWMKFLNEYQISIDMFVNRIVNIDEYETTTFLNYIKDILNSSQTDKLIIDVSNGPSEFKIILAIIAYILEISYVYCIDSVSLFKKEPLGSYLGEKQTEKYYREMIKSKKIDELAYMNMTEIIRYKEKVNKLSDIYLEFNEGFNNAEFFRNNLLSAILLKIKSDNEDMFNDSMYRISSTAIAASLEDLIDHLLLNYSIDKTEKETLGSKIFKLQNKIKETASSEFDYEFLEKFNGFILYLRNSTTHKALNISDSERFKAALSLQMSLIFLEYYSTVIYHELRKIVDKDVSNINTSFEIKELNLDDLKERYYGLDGDNTGVTLESLFQSNRSEKEIKELSSKIKKAKDAVVKYIKSFPNSKIIFAEGDDILFKGIFKIKELKKMLQIYSNESDGLTCSIGYGNTFKELLISMKIAKIEKNSIKGIYIVEKDSSNNIEE